MDSTRSAAVTPGRGTPESRTPTTSGTTTGMGSPSMAASASMPPTPQPSTPIPPIMVVCESVPTRVSGWATGPSAPPATVTTEARNSMLTWWTIPLPGGTTRRLANASSAHRANRKRSALRSCSAARLAARASLVPAASTCSEWSMTKTVGTTGSTEEGSPPRRARAERMAARPMRAGMPVKS